MNISRRKPVHVILFCRTLLVVLSVAVCAIAAEDFQTILKKAEGGDAAAQHYLAWMYANGEGVAKSREESAKWIRKAAEQGKAETQYMLGEAYANGYGGFREVTSNTNLLDSQSRRLNIRYIDEGGKKQFVHTISATAVTDRVVCAMLENSQQEDGSVIVPEVLRPLTGFERVEAPG